MCSNTGVYWVVAKGESNSCTKACQSEPIPTVCAGDSPEYTGWPYSKADVVGILRLLDPIRYQRIKKCETELIVSAGNDDHNPEFFYYDQLDFSKDCRFYLLTKSKSYKCKSTVFYDGAHRLCPCCINTGKQN